MVLSAPKRSPSKGFPKVLLHQKLHINFAFVKTHTVLAPFLFFFRTKNTNVEVLVFSSNKRKDCELPRPNHFFITSLGGITCQVATGKADSLAMVEHG